MATKLESDFINACILAEGNRQAAKEAAAVIYGYDSTKYAAYITAIIAADTQYVTDITPACTAAGISPTVVPPNGLMGGQIATIVT